MRLDQPRRYYEPALKLDSASVEAYAGLGQIHSFRGDQGQAETFLLRALEKNPSLKLPYDMLGLIYLRRGDLLRSRQTYEALVRRLPADPTGYYGQALILIEEKRWSDARERLEKALALEPGAVQTKDLLDFVKRQAEQAKPAQ